MEIQVNMPLDVFEDKISKSEIQVNDLNYIYRDKANIGVFDHNNNSFKLVFIKKDRMNGTFQLPLTYLDCVYKYNKKEKIVIIRYKIKKLNLIKSLIKLNILLIILCFLFIFVNRDLNTVNQILPFILIEILFLITPNYRDVKALKSFLEDNDSQLT